jgi:predicted membrane-bound spermidine synthase
MTQFDYVKPIRIYVPSFGEWGFFVGSNFKIDEVWIDTVNKEDIDLKYLNDEVLKNMENFSSDIKKNYEGERVNSSTNPILYREYIKEYNEVGF